MCLSCASHVTIMCMSGEWRVHEEETRAAEDMDVEQHTMAPNAEVCGCVWCCTQKHTVYGVITRAYCINYRVIFAVC